MNYTRISADCHIDLPWVPPDLFTSGASAPMKDRMPYVTDGPDGPFWTAKNGVSFGLVGGGGPAGAKDVPGPPHRADGPAGPCWAAKNGVSFGLVGGVGPAGSKYVPGQHHRVDVMAATGLYADGKKGIHPPGAP